MPANTGRTVSRHIRVIVGDSANTLRALPVNRISAVGVTYDAQDMTVYQDAVMGMLNNMPSAPIEFSGVFDSTAAAAAPALSGSHTVLEPLNGLNIPRSLDIQFGIRQAWEAGEPQFGITRTATSGSILTSYIVNPDDMTYTARFELFPGSALPAWGTTAEAGS
jgi:hypothetical protein